jgi:photosystem II stability/assembly factor-like uncharacterized protein
MLTTTRNLLFLLILSFCPNGIAAEKDKQPSPGLNEATLKGMEWRNIGPAMTAGRIADIAVNPEDRSTWYVGVGSGGVWKTENRGTTWNPVFDSEGSYSIGSISIDPNQSETIWVGTGENVSGRHVGFGDGIYKSLDGGKSWTNMGLKDSQHIGMIAVDPRDSNVVFVAAQGPLWSAGGERGLFKTTDGGKTWKNILSAGEYTGANEVHFDPLNPDILYASLHQRFRNVAALMDGGPESGIHKSTDGGKTWRELSEGIPKEDKGKIGLSISPVDSKVIYATIELAQRTGGMWRSVDAGESWEKRSDEVYSGTGPHYYQEIFASPHDVDTVYQVAPALYRSVDGGKTMQAVKTRTVHSDYHEVVFDPNDPDYLLVGTDGGVYESFDNAANWKFFANMPITQFYKVTVDYDLPFYNIYGGTQDNNTQGGPSRTDNVHGIRNSDWYVTVFADGHQSAADPTNPDIIYSEWQQGNLVRFDRKTGEIVYIQPQPEAGEDAERFNWDAPILISPHDSARIYHASQRVWRSDNRGDSWTAISGDLSHARDRMKLPLMGRIWSYDSAWDLMAMSKFGSITSLSESPLVEDLLYAGTDDGRIHVSNNGGAKWTAIDSLPDVPDGFFVNDIKADLHDADTVYVVVDDHKSGDFSAYILKSTNRGKSWRSISEGLPERHVAWRLVQDHVNPELLFAATEFGVFFTVGGGKWVKLAGGAPNISIRDLAIQKRENDLVAASFGRSFFVLDDYSPLRELSASKLASDTMLFPVRDALWYLQRMPLGEFRVGSKASQGDAYYVADNPPFGAVITYYLPESIMTSKEKRRESEKKIEKQGGDTAYPGWQALRAEGSEEDPAVVLTIRDSNGEVVRKLEGPAKAGFHRVAWDLRYPQSSPWTAKPQDNYIVFSGPLAAPGKYTVSLATRVNGTLKDSGQQTDIQVNLMRQNSLATASPNEVVAFSKRLDDLMREGNGAGSAMKTLLTELGAIKQTLLRSGTEGDLRSRARALELELMDLQLKLSGDENRALAGASGPVSVSARINVAQLGTAFSSYGPAPMHERSLEIAEQDFASIKTSLDRIFNTDIPALRKAMDEAGVPWTPGRGVPGKG